MDMTIAAIINAPQTATVINAARFFGFGFVLSSFICTSCQIICIVGINVFSVTEIKEITVYRYQRASLVFGRSLEELLCNGVFDLTSVVEPEGDEEICSEIVGFCAVYVNDYYRADMDAIVEFNAGTD